MSIGAVEDWCLGQLRTELGTVVRKIAALPGAWNEEMLDRMLREGPALYLTFLGGNASDRTHLRQIDGRWVVYAVTSHQQSEEARRRGDGRTKGTWNLIELAIAVLDGRAIPEEGTIELVNVENLWDGEFEKRHLAILAALFRIPTTVAAPLDSSGLNEFTILANWDTTPSDGQFESTDEISLETQTP